MTGRTVLAIDQGTSGTKAIVVDAVDGILAIAEEPVRPAYLAGGGVEQDPGALLQSVLETGRRAIAAAGRPVDGMALANQGETVLAWDPHTGAALSVAISWQDRRSEALIAAVAADSEWISQRTGLVLDPYFSAPKMAWLREHVTRSGVVTTTDSWLLHHLCGAFVTDASTASRSLLTDLDDVTWDHRLLDVFGLAAEELPRIVACDEIVGGTTAFGPELQVGGLVVDQQAALFAQGCFEPGMAKCTFGTGAFLLANTGSNAVRPSSGLTSSVAWRVRDETVYCLDGQVYTAASAVRWMQDLGLIESASDVDQGAAADAGGVLCVPAFAGLAAPWWRADATASFTGLTLSSGSSELILAVVQGIAAQVAELAELFATDLGSPLIRLRVDGGLTQSHTLMQSTADLTQLPIDVFPSPHATALGAAALGALALDPSLEVASAVADWQPTQSFEPRWSLDQTTDFRRRWRAAAAANLSTGGTR